MKNGEGIGEYEIGKLSKFDLVTKMLGKELKEFSSDGVVNKKQVETGVAMQYKSFPASFELKVKSMGKKGSISPFDLDLRGGEVVGLAGLLGSGRTEIARLIFGIDKADSGEVSINGTSVLLNSPFKAIAHGLGFCPEDRKTSGIIDELSVRENIILALQGKKGIFRFINRKEQEELAEKHIKALGILTPSSQQAIKFLSGGNQQKVILARWLATNPQLLILDEPTCGIDVGAVVTNCLQC